MKFTLFFMHLLYHYALVVSKHVILHRPITCSWLMTNSNVDHFQNVQNWALQILARSILHRFAGIKQERNFWWLKIICVLKIPDILVLNSNDPEHLWNLHRMPLIPCNCSTNTYVFHWSDTHILQHTNTLSTREFIAMNFCQQSVWYAQTSYLLVTTKQFLCLLLIRL